MKDSKIIRFNDNLIINNFHNNDDMDFLSWKIRLNKGLLSFWDSINKEIDE